MTANNVRQWLQSGDVDKLENLLLEGRGTRLLGETSPDLRTRVFLNAVPQYLTRITEIHEAAVRGSLSDVKRIVAEEPKKKLATSKDKSGIPLIHKAVFNDHQDIIEWLAEAFPVTLGQKDREGRTALHYCSATARPGLIWDILINAGSDASICDKSGHPAAYYLNKSADSEIKGLETMSVQKLTVNKETLNFKPSNIRIWIHNRDIGKLQRVLWEGHGAKLRCETSNNPRVKKFLEAAPFIMGTIKDIHVAAINNDVDIFKQKTDDPVSPLILCSKDSNGLNVLHKAAGLGYLGVAQDILLKYPQTVVMQDSDGKTPLHYAAALKDDGIMYDLLIQNGADEDILDNKQKPASFYKTRSTDVDATHLTVIPEAPRVSGTTYPKNWDWRILETGDNAVRAGMRKAMSSIEINKAVVSNEISPEPVVDSQENVEVAEDSGKQIENVADNSEARTSSGSDEVIGGHESPGKNLNANGENEGLETGQEHDPESGQEAEPEHGSGPATSPHPDVEQENEPDPGSRETPRPKSVVTPGLDPESNMKSNEELGMELEHETEQNSDTELAEEPEPENPEEEEPIGDELEDKLSVDEGIVNNSILDDIQNNNDEGINRDDEGTEETHGLEDENTLGQSPIQDEKTEPSIGDSGLEDTIHDDDQVIVGEHQEYADAELDDSAMTVDPEVEDLVENGNMEQLAAMVLNGDGRRLVGRHSSNPALQAFIDNVPAYIGKIHAVHMAAREGNLRDLQSALDRRKFAVARDGSSPNGTTPLHVAVIFGHTNVIKYLAGRFSETVHAVDRDGRTPLHYAATLADNDHYYSLLQNLGANPLVQDNFGHKADYYKVHQEDFSHKKVLRDFGANENAAADMLTDKVPGGDTSSARRDVSNPETLATLERCFRVLAGGQKSARGSSIALQSSTTGTLVERCLKRPVFDTLKHRLTRLDHNLFDVIWPTLKKYSLNDTSNGNHPIGSTPSSESARSVRVRRPFQKSYDDEKFSGTVVVPDYESYVVFAELLDPIIREMHCVSPTGDLPDHPSSWFFDPDPDPNLNPEPSELDESQPPKTIDLVRSLDLDPAGKYVLAGTVEACRNLEDYFLPLNLTVSQLENSEHEITTELSSPELSAFMAEGNNEEEGGNYYTLNEVMERPSEIRARLAAAGLLEPLISSCITDHERLHGKYWPYGRGVFVASSGDLAVWINVQDHLRAVCSTSAERPGQIGKAYARLGRLMTILDSRLRFKRDDKLGFLSSRPVALGNSLNFSLVVKFPQLSKEPGNLRHLCTVRGLDIRETMQRDTVKISNQQSLAITELQTLENFFRAVHNILSLEKELNLGSTMKIAAMVTNIFRKRKSSSRQSQA